MTTSLDTLSLHEIDAALAALDHMPLSDHPTVEGSSARDDRLEKVAEIYEASRRPQPLARYMVEAKKLERCPVASSSSSSTTPLTPPTTSIATTSTTRTSTPKTTTSTSTSTSTSTKKLALDPKIPALVRLIKTITYAADHHGIAISLNLSPARERALLLADDPTRVFSDFINRAMKKLVGVAVPYSFAFEFSPEGRLHVHGVFIPANDTPAHHMAIRRAFRLAAGKIAGRSGSRQLCAVDLFDADGWSGYTLKTYKRTVKRLGTKKFIFISRSMSILVDPSVTCIGKSLSGDLLLGASKSIVDKHHDKALDVVLVTRITKEIHMSEFYLPVPRYNILVRLIRDNLRKKPRDKLGRQLAALAPLMLQSGLWPAGGASLDLDDEEFSNGPHDAVVKALAAMEADEPSGRFEDHQVRYVLGEVGDIWPDSIRPTAHDDGHMLRLLD